LAKRSDLAGKPLVRQVARFVEGQAKQLTNMADPMLKVAEESL
jgi:hypothetical protein